MSDTTKANVLLIASELSAITDDDLWNLILSDVASEVSSSVYGVKQEKAQRYLAAHYMTLSSPTTLAPGAASGPLVSETIGKHRVSFSEPAELSDATRYDETKYGRIFSQLRLSCYTAFQVVTP